MNNLQKLILVGGVIALIIAILTAPLIVVIEGKRFPYRTEFYYFSPVRDLNSVLVRSIIIVSLTLVLFFIAKGVDIQVSKVQIFNRWERLTKFCKAFYKKKWWIRILIISATMWILHSILEASITDRSLLLWIYLIIVFISITIAFFWWAIKKINKAYSDEKGEFPKVSASKPKSLPPKELLMPPGELLMRKKDWWNTR